MSNIILDPKDPKANHKQIKFFVDVLRHLDRNDDDACRFFWYGGAIRGGKTFICLFIFIWLCLRYPGSRWYVVRKAFPDLRRTAIPSLEKLLKGSKKVKRWSRSSSDYFVEFHNGSRIYMFAESYQQDKDYDRWKGIECNGFLLEQVEEMMQETYNKSLERSGSWYIYDKDGNAIDVPAVNFGTFNPAYNWVKKNIYLKYKKGELLPPDYFLEALPDDNPHVTEEQWKSWKRMDPETYNRFIKAIWDQELEGVFFHQFDENKHVGDRAKYKDGLDLWVSFDFNVDPMTATIFQTDEETFYHVLAEIRLPDSDTYEACEAIDTKFGHLLPYYMITGDASGRARMSGARRHLNHYQIIKNELDLIPEQIRVPKANPFISESRSFVSAVMALPKEEFDFCIHPDCEYTIQDLKFVEKDYDKEGKLKIKKNGINKFLLIDNNQLGHLADNVRYGMHTTLIDLVDIHRS